MRINKITLYQYNKPFIYDFYSSHTLRTTSESIILKLTFDNGIIGYGESSPRTYVTQEDQASVVRTIQHCFSPILHSRQINIIDDVAWILNDLERECIKKNILHYNSALGAVDIALLDGIGKLEQLSASQYLGTEIRKEIPYSISIPIIPPEKIMKLIPMLKNIECHYVKVLLGTDEAQNIERVRLAKNLFGEDIDLRVEANGKLTYKQVISNLEKMEEFNLSAIEQPIAANDVDGLKQIKEAVDIPVIVDESMCSIKDAQNLIENEACDILNIKISKCGGILRSRQIADFARSRNILCQMGAHVGETEILHLAGKHFAMTTPDLKYFEGCSFFLFEDLLQPIDVEVKIDAEKFSDNIGLGVSQETQESIMSDCVPLVELAH